MAIELRKSRLFASLALSLLFAPAAQAASPSAQDALALQPVQKDVQIDRPEAAELAKCTIKAEKINGKTGWVVRDPSGQVLRVFTDTNGDNVVDQWSYYKDGVEIYRDIDSNFNKKADQYRWLNTAGSRWGMDVNEDGKIDAWKAISAEEVSAELVAALRDRDRARFERLLLTAKEAKALGLGQAKADLLQKKIDMAPAAFVKLAGQQKVIGNDGKWVSFGGYQPGAVPAGTEDSKADLIVYENVMAMVDSDGKTQPITVGTMVRVGDVWRLIDVPEISDQTAELADYKPFFFAVARNDRAEAPINKPNQRMEELMKELHALGEITPNSPAKTHEKRFELLKQLADESETPEMRSQWYRQLADTLSASVQTGGYADGVGKLKELADTLAADPQDDELAAYAKFRWMTAEHSQELMKPGTDFAKVQEKWIDSLEKFVEGGKKYPDSADAMMELAIAQEFGGDEEKALKWYEAIVKEFPDSPVFRKAQGAKTRLTSVGKPIQLRGKLINGPGNFDLDTMVGKKTVVLIQYWATWCEPCKADMPLLKELRAKYKGGFEVVGVNLDNNKQEMINFLKENDPRWPQLFEEGGLDNRFANEMGIQTLPTMILVDQQGKVVNRNIRAQELDAELKKLLK